MRSLMIVSVIVSVLLIAEKDAFAIGEAKVSLIENHSSHRSYEAVMPSRAVKVLSEVQVKQVKKMVSKFRENTFGALAGKPVAGFDEKNPMID
ncbi:MAG: hypothetical protein R3B45_17005 [Bdellovibrionota bacterium]